LFRDAQRRILDELLQTTWQEVEASFRHTYEHNYAIIQMMRGLNIPLPRALATSAEFVINLDLSKAMQDEKLDLEKVRLLVQEASRLSVALDKSALGYHASRKIDALMQELERSPEDIARLETIESTVNVLVGMELDLDLQKAQNTLFTISRQIYPRIRQKASSGDDVGRRWIERFTSLADYLGVSIQ
jgi:hypothetical protein